MLSLNSEQKQWIENKLNSMTVREKIAQITCMSFYDVIWEDCPERTDMSYEKYIERIDRAMEKYPVGNLFVGSEVVHEAEGGVEVFHDLIKYMQSKADIPLLIASDIENGVGTAFSKMTQFPKNVVLAVNGDVKTAYDMSALIAKEAKAIGINWSFGPVVDLCDNWMRNGNMRNISDEPEEVIKYAKALIDGLQDEGVVACAKHFPDGCCDYKNAHIARTENLKSEEEWMASTGKIYKELSDHGVASVMAAHTALGWAEEYDEENCGYCPASVSKNAIQSVLRDELGFDGVVVTDAISMTGLTSWKTAKERTIDMFNAGVDVMLFAKKREFTYLEEAISNGDIPMANIDASVRRVLKMKCMFGLFEQSDTFGSLERIQEEAKPLNRYLSEKTITCVRNMQNLLPLSKEKVNKILVLGLTMDARMGQIGAFVNLLKQKGFALDVYDARDFEDWNKTPELITRAKNGEKWDAYFWLFDYAFIGDYRPTGLIAQAIWRAHVEELSPILISLSSPFLLEDIPSAKTFITTLFSRSEFTPEALVKAIFGEEEFNYSLPLKFLRDRAERSER